MRRLAMLLLMLSSGCAPMIGPEGTTRVGLSLDFRSAPPPPAIAYDYEPDVYELPGTSVFVVDDPSYDLCRYGGYWFLSYQGYWYRADSYRGPFVAVDVRRVPRDVQYAHGEQGWRHGNRGRHEGWRDRDDRDDRN